MYTTYIEKLHWKITWPPYHMTYPLWLRLPVTCVRVSSWREQGILFAQPDCIRYPIELVHLWLHESSRVYSDKLMEEKDEELFNKILIDTGKRYFEVKASSLWWWETFSSAKSKYSHIDYLVLQQTPRAKGTWLEFRCKMLRSRGLRHLESRITKS